MRGACACVCTRDVCRATACGAVVSELVPNKQKVEHSGAATSHAPADGSDAVTRPATSTPLLATRSHYRNTRSRAVLPLNDAPPPRASGRQRRWTVPALRWRRAVRRRVAPQLAQPREATWQSRSWSRRYRGVWHDQGRVHAPALLRLHTRDSRLQSLGADRPLKVHRPSASQGCRLRLSLVV